MSPGPAGARIVLAVLVPLAGTPPSAAARRLPAFGAAVEAVGLSVSVTDDRNRFVADLQEEDFAVFEDGVPQQPFLFEREEVPISLVLMIDASSSMAETLEATQAAALRLVRTLGPRDRAQVVEFGDHTRISQDFTSDQPVLERAIRGAHAYGETALRNALYEVLRQVARLRRDEVRRRWAVVLLSDGEDTCSIVTDDDVLDLARKTDVTVHTIGLRPRRVPREARFSLARAWHFLASVARATGGEAHLPRSPGELDSVYDRLAAALRTQYVLAYVPANARRDGSWRRVQVRIPGRPDLVPQHKPGYSAPAK